MKCYVDMDGVLVDFVPAWLAHRGLAMPNPWPRGMHSMAEVYNLPSARLWQGCDDDWWASLPKTADADQILDIVERRFAPEDIYLVSNPQPCAGASGKLWWLQRHYPRFLGRFLLTPCREILANAEAVLIDDQSNNTELFGRCGGHGILLPRMWNIAAMKSNQALIELTARLDSY